MADAERSPAHEQLERLRGWRNRPKRDLGLGYLSDHVRRNIERPYKQLLRIQEPWRQHIPENLLNRCVLAGLVRGILTVEVTNSATAYELDRALRGGAERRIRAACRFPLRRIQVRVVPADRRGV